MDYNTACTRGVVMRPKRFAQELAKVLRKDVLRYRDDTPFVSLVVKDYMWLDNGWAITLFSGSQELQIWVREIKNIPPDGK